MKFNDGYYSCRAYIMIEANPSNWRSLAISFVTSGPCDEYDVSFWWWSYVLFTWRIGNKINEFSIWDKVRWFWICTVRKRKSRYHNVTSMVTLRIWVSTPPSLVRLYDDDARRWMLWRPVMIVVTVMSRDLVTVCVVTVKIWVFRVCKRFPTTYLLISSWRSPSNLCLWSDTMFFVVN